MELQLKMAQETPRLNKLRTVLGNTESINQQTANFLLREIDRNIVEQGIWDRWKWAPPRPTTTYARSARGKDPRPLWGLRGRFGARVGKTRFTIYSTSKYAELMQEGPSKRWWVIRPKLKHYLSFPHPQGRTRKGFGGLWALAEMVRHKGWPKRRLMPPLDEVGSAARLFVEAAIKGIIK